MSFESKIVDVLEDSNKSWPDWKVVHTCTQCGGGDPGVSHALGMVVGYHLFKNEVNPEISNLTGQVLLGVYLCWKCIDNNIETKDEWGGFATR